MTSLDRRLDRLAREHDGLITRTHAAARQLSPNVLRAAVRDGLLHRIRPGLFVTGERWRAARAHERYTLTVRGILLSHPDWIGSHHAALALAGLPLFDVDLGVVDVVAPVKASKVRPGLHIHVATPGQLVRVAEGSPRTVTVAEACVLTAAASGFDAGVVAMDAALARSLSTKAGLRTALELPGARFGVASARAAIEAADPKAESPGETRTRLILIEAGLQVRSQVSIEDSDGLVGRVDFLVGDRVIVEFDGLVKYEGADGKLALAREKSREDRLRAAGFRVVRVTWAELAHPDRVVRRVRRELASAA
ncbi:MAG: type IV toxin-antitoxin system AbiEi family antitoxin domain-containing protein [Knoellia sp.]